MLVSSFKCLTFVPLFSSIIILVGCQNATPYFKTAGEPIKVKGGHSAKKLTATELIDALALEGHVEGGYFKQTFKADHRATLSTEHGERVTMTSIYYLLTGESPIGHFHMNRSDIMHYFHMGDPITYYLINEDGSLETHVLGPDPTQGHKLQMVVKGGTWKASVIPQKGPYGYGLIGEAVAPGFEYSDMQLGKRSAMLSAFPQHGELIKKLTR